ncbi:MAG TPA: SpoIID/LytB domain-containing protein [Rhodothermales bacterium]|nr:SpoIID/LytB domain-containing protein [Rhodothermales bacterium]
MNRHLPSLPRLLSSLPLLLVLTVPSVHAQQRSVRVRILERYSPRVVTIAAVGGPVKVYGSDSDAPAGTLAPGQHARIEATAGSIEAALPSGALRASEIRFVPAPSGGVQVAVEESRPLQRPRLYRGGLRVDPARTGSTLLRIINEVGLEEYVASVLPREYPFDDMEGAKAMAVVIRTYALRSTDKYGPDYDQVDHTGSQVYEGSGKITPLAHEATQATEGMILTYRDRPIEATYYASNGGYTANNEDVWQAPALPYLRAKADPYDASPEHSWTSTLPRVQVIGVLTSAYGGGQRVADFDPISFGRDGRAQFVRITLADGTERKVPSNRFRMAIIRHFGAKSLRSTRFSVSHTRESYVLSGSGYGHGVGLSQWGTHEMAQRGRSFQDILSFYYAGVDLDALGSLDLATEADTRRGHRRMAGTAPTPSEPDRPRTGR